MKSSYTDYEEIFKFLVWISNPKKIVEFGILEGFSLLQIAKASPETCLIEAYDIFENFNGNSAKRDIYEKFSEFKNVKIQEADFYKSVDIFEDSSIDILHIDIANDGSTYKFAIEKYFDKIKKGGFLLLEGGTVERDNVEWMKKYNKESIVSYLENIKNKYEVFTFTKFPSLTCVKKI